MSEEGLLPVMALTESSDLECCRIAIYCLGSLAETEEVKNKLLDIGTLPKIVAQSKNPDIEMKRNCGYLFALLAEDMDAHDDIVREGGMESIIALASIEDVECQEYATFCLAHLASNRQYQVPLVKQGALRPLVTMMSVGSEPCHYAGLALLKLADNFENHVSIAEEGGVQALLKLVRDNSTDTELSYKAASSLGTLSSNAVDKLPGFNHVGSSVIGTGASKMSKLSGGLAARSAQEKTSSYITSKIQRQREKMN